MCIHQKPLRHPAVQRSAGLAPTPPIQRSSGAAACRPSGHMEKPLARARAAPQEPPGPSSLHQRSTAQIGLPKSHFPQRPVRPDRRCGRRPAVLYLSFSRRPPLMLLPLQAPVPSTHPSDIGKGTSDSRVKKRTPILIDIWLEAVLHG
jgi:hypothetical protein